MALEVFNRYELKFILDKSMAQEMIQALKGHVMLDQYGDGEGFYRIINLYYDTEDHLFFHETVNRQEFRQKLRLRAYNKVSIDTPVFLEIKKKYDGVVYKRRTMLTLQDAYAFLAKGQEQQDYSVYDASNVQILGEVAFLKRFYSLAPKVVVSYDRQAFLGIKENDLRITFDSNLRKRESDLKLESGPWGELFMDASSYILEIKVNGRIPLWLAQILSGFQCWRQGYSKYTSSYNAELFQQEQLDII